MVANNVRRFQNPPLHIFIQNGWVSHPLVGSINSYHFAYILFISFAYSTLSDGVRSNSQSKPFGLGTCLHPGRGKKSSSVHEHV